MLDLGTNTALCTVFFASDRDPRRLRVAEDLHFVTGLGRERGADGSLSDDGRERALRSLRYISRRLDELGVPPGAVRGAATAACREAPNGGAFLRQVADELGLTYDIVAGEREATLMAGAQRKAWPDDQELTVVDVGGGSTEVVLLAGDRFVRSIPMGATKLLDALGPTPTVAEVDAAVQAALEPEELPQARGRLVGVAGTVTTAREVLDGATTWDPVRLEGASITRDELLGLSDRLLAMAPPARRALPGLHPLRADALGPSCRWLVGILDRLGRDAMSVSDQGVRYGLLYEAWPRAVVGA